ncbi:MAG: SRPBCC family protein [Planctomycetes bacterium]|nr:SRPBCC family protein [Planctomycetota bacterium]
MKPLTVSRSVPAPPERVFALLTDLDGAPGRIRNIRSVEKLVPGPLRVGTRWKETRLMFGREASEVMEALALEPGRRMEVGAESCGMRYRTVLEVAREGAGTRVSMTFSGQPVTLAARLMAPLAGLMAGKLRQCLEEDLEDIGKAAAG